MLQQTQAARVEPMFPSFVRRFETYLRDAHRQRESATLASAVRDRRADHNKRRGSAAGSRVRVAERLR